MADSMHSKSAIVPSGGLNDTVSHPIIQPPTPSAEESATPQLKTAKAVREQAKAIAAAIARKIPAEDRGPRRVRERTPLTELPTNPVPADPDCWLTPKKLIDKVLGALGIAAFTIDVASPGADLSYIPALRYFMKDDPEGCGLRWPWIGGSVWMNCPYSEIGPWVARADEAVRSGRVGIVVALLPSRVNAAWFAEHVSPRARVLFLPARVRFYAEVGKLGGSPRFGSMLCVWGGTPGQVAALEEAFGTASVGCIERRPRPVVEEQSPDDEAAVTPEMDMDDAGRQMSLRTIDLFSGGGSVHLAMEAAGLATAYANDLCPEKRETFAANFPHVRLDPRSITEVCGHELPDAGTLLASSPCPDHSTSGRRLGFAGERGVLAFEVVRLVRELAVLGRAPGVVVFENVLGLLELDGGRDFADLVEALMTAGYDVGALVVDARRFVPQSRRRLFIVAVRSGTPLPPGLAAGRHSRLWHPTPLRRAHAALSAGARRSWRWWIVPVPPRRTTVLADLLEPAVPAGSWATEATVAGMVALLPPREQAKIGRALEAGVRVGVIKERREVEGAERHRHWEVFFDGCARCFQRNEGGRRQRLVVLDEAAPSGMRVRDLTPRERARLTGLPDDYVLPGIVRSRQLTGDAVVVPAYGWLARHLVRPLTEAAAAAYPRVAGVARLAVDRADRRMDDLAGTRDAMGQVIVKAGANRPSKQVSVRTEVANLLEADVEIEAHAVEEKVSKAELYRRALDCYRFTQGRPRLPKYVPLARTPGLRPKAVREAEVRRRRGYARQAEGKGRAGEGDITTLCRLACRVHLAVRSSVQGNGTVAACPGTCRASFSHSATWAGRAGSRQTWHD